MAIETKIAATGIKALLKKLGPGLLRTLGIVGGGPITSAISLILWLPLLSKLGSKGLEALRSDTKGGLLGQSKEGLKKAIEKAARQVSDKEALASTLQDQTLQSRERDRDALASAGTGLMSAIQAREAGRIEKGLQRGRGEAIRESAGLLTPDEHEDVRSTIIQAGLPREF